MKRKTADFLSAFIISIIIFSSIMLLTTNNLIEIRINDTGRFYTAELFKNTYRIEKKSVENFLLLLDFNKNIFGSAAYFTVSKFFSVFYGFFSNLLKLSYGVFLSFAGGI